MQMADELYDLLDRDTVERSRIFLPESSHSFLDKIVKPIYEILAAVRIDAVLFLLCVSLNLLSNILKACFFHSSNIAVGTQCCCLKCTIAL